MLYSIKQLADLAGVSTRTLRWYERIGLLAPQRQDNGYRLYDRSNVERLQQVLYYRELGLELSVIQQMMDASGFDPLYAMEEQLSALIERREQTERLIAALEKTIRSRKDGTEMSDAEKFEALKQKALEENEAKYGAEVRARFGDAAVEESNQRFAGLTPERYKEMTALSEQINADLAAAVAVADPTSPEAEQLVADHKRWLLFFWKEYTPDMHKGLAQAYVDDHRFQEFYEAVAPGAAEYLRDAILHWA